MSKILLQKNWLEKGTKKIWRNRNKKISDKYFDLKYFLFLTNNIKSQKNDKRTT